MLIRIFLLAFAVAVLLNFGHPLNSDEGITLTGAWNMLQGKRLYVDFFEFAAPGAYVLTWLSFVVLGTHYWSAKALALLLLAASASAVFFVAERIGASKGSARGAALAWVVIVSLPGIFVNHNPLSAFLAAIALALLLYAYAAPDRLHRWLLAGLAAGLVLAFHQSKGLLLAGSIAIALVVLWWRRDTPRATFAVAMVAAAAAPTVAALAVWGPTLLYDRLVAWPSQHYASVSSVAPVRFVGAVIVFAALARVAWTAGGDRVALSLVLLVQSALLLSTLTRPDLDHLVFNAFGLVALAAVGWDRLSPDVRRRWTGAVCALAVVVVAIRVTRNATMGASRSAILNSLRARGVTRFYAEAVIPQLYFELRATNPYPYSLLVTHMHTADQFAENMSVLARERPPFVLRNRDIVEKYAYDWSNPLDLWIDAHYEHVADSGNVEILAQR